MPVLPQKPWWSAISPCPWWWRCGRCPKCGGRLFKAPAPAGSPGSSTPLAVSTPTTAAGGATCDFMTWDVPVKDDCPVCGKTMFKRAGKATSGPTASIRSAPTSCRRTSGTIPRSRWRHPPTRRRPPARATHLLRKSPAKKTAAKKTSQDCCKENHREKDRKKAEDGDAEKKPAAKKAAVKKAVAKTTTKNYY